VTSIILRKTHALLRLANAVSPLHSTRGYGVATMSRLLKVHHELYDVTNSHSSRALLRLANAVSPLHSTRGEPYLSTKEPYLSSKSPVYPQMSPTYPQRSLTINKRAQYVHERALSIHQRALSLVKEHELTFFPCTGQAKKQSLAEIWSQRCIEEFFMQGKS